MTKSERIQKNFRSYFYSGADGIFSPITARAAIVEGYNDHDINALLDFAKQQEDGKLNWDVQTPPSEWEGVTWIKSGDTRRLMELDIYDRDYSNRLSGELNLSNCTSLKVLDCSFNELTELDLTKTAMLYYLDCSGNNISTLDVSKCPKLEWLD